MLINVEDDTNQDGFTFEFWKSRVDNAISDATGGLSLDDLPDQDEWDAWNSGRDPIEFAKEVIATECGTEDEQ